MLSSLLNQLLQFDTREMANLYFLCNIPVQIIFQLIKVMLLHFLFGFGNEL